MKKRILRKSKVLREGYMDGLRKAANEIGRILLTEDPMITSDMHQTYKTNSQKQSEWYNKRNEIEQFVCDYTDIVSEKVFDIIYNVMKDPSGHDVEIVYNQYPYSRHAGFKCYFKVDGYDLLLVSIEPDTQTILTSPMSAKKYLSTPEGKAVFQELKKDFEGYVDVDKVKNSVFGKTLVNVLYNAKCDNDEETCDIISEFISELKYHNAAKQLSDEEFKKFAKEKHFNYGESGDDFVEFLVTGENSLLKIKDWEDAYNDLTDEVMGYSLADYR